MKNIKNHNVGESTDDELEPTDESKFKNKFEELEEARKRLFDDDVVFFSWVEMRFTITTRGYYFWP